MGKIGISRKSRRLAKIRQVKPKHDVLNMNSVRTKNDHDYFIFYHPAEAFALNLCVHTFLP